MTWPAPFREEITMKITVIKKATAVKPMMGCPVFIDDASLAKR